MLPRLQTTNFSCSQTAPFSLLPYSMIGHRSLVTLSCDLTRPFIHIWREFSDYYKCATGFILSILFLLFGSLRDQSTRASSNNNQIPLKTATISPILRQRGLPLDGFDHQELPTRGIRNNNNKLSRECRK